MTYTVLVETLNPIHSLTHSLTHSLSEHIHIMFDEMQICEHSACWMVDWLTCLHSRCEAVITVAWCFIDHMTDYVGCITLCFTLVLLKQNYDELC